MTSELSQDYRLPIEAIEFYKENGFVKLSKVLSTATLEYYGEVITRETLRLNTQIKPLEERETYERAFLQIMNLWRHNQIVREFVFSKRLAKIAAELLEVEGVRLYHDQSLYKEPSGGITPAHADQYYWPLDSDKTVTAWIPLQATPSQMGPLAFYEKSQNFIEGRDLQISDESEAKITSNMERAGFKLFCEDFELGDISFHSGWTFHRAGANNSTMPRSVMTMIYMDAQMRLLQPKNHMQEADWKQWCPGAKIGEIIDTELNPIIYQNGENH